MSTLTILLLVILNFGISWWNAKVTGQIWLESKAIGGISRVMAWVGAMNNIRNRAEEIVKSELIYN